MATETFYEKRMKEIQQERSEKLSRSNPLLQRPNRNAETLAGPNPMPQEAPEEQPEYTKSGFFMNAERFKQEDPNFGPMMQNYTKLAMGLKKLVDQGVMPEPIARQRLEQFLQDNRTGYKKQPPQELGGALSGQAPQESIDPAEQPPAEQALVEEVPNGMA